MNQYQVTLNGKPWMIYAGKFTVSETGRLELFFPAGARCAAFNNWDSIVQVRDDIDVDRLGDSKEAA